jgi:hypothetical protein
MAAPLSAILRFCDSFVRIRILSISPSNVPAAEILIRPFGHNTTLVSENRQSTAKKFCDDQCRTNYNNRLRTEDNSFLKEVNRILKKKRDILHSNNPGGKTKIKRALLVRKGFDLITIPILTLHKKVQPTFSAMNTDISH